MDEATARRRLVTNESVTAQHGPKRVATDLAAFVAALREAGAAGAGPAGDGAPGSAAERARDRLLLTLAAFEFQARRLPAVAGRCAQDEAHYAAKQQSIAAEIAAAERDLEALKAQLEQERLRQTQRALYEQMVKGVVNRHASREVLQSQLAAVEAEYAAAQAEAAALDATALRRGAQFAPVFEAIRAMQAALEEEAAAEARAQAAAAAAAALEAAARRAEAAALQLRQRAGAAAAGAGGLGGGASGLGGAGGGAAGAGGAGSGAVEAIEEAAIASDLRSGEGGDDAKASSKFGVASAEGDEGEGAAAGGGTAEAATGAGASAAAPLQGEPEVAEGVAEGMDEAAEGVSSASGSGSAAAADTMAVDEAGAVEGADEGPDEDAAVDAAEDAVEGAEEDADAEEGAAGEADAPPSLPAGAASTGGGEDGEMADS